jgi:two-component sensor histidine kinase
MTGESLSKTIAFAEVSESPALPRSVIVAEANHRIANNLSLVASLLSMKAREVADRGTPMLPLAAFELLVEAGSKIQVIADLHRTFSIHGDDAVDLGDYLEGIGRAVIGSMARSQQVEFHAELDRPCTCPAETASHVGLIVNELLINALKYAHPAERVKGRIEFGCRPCAGGVEIWVGDDGVGLPDEFDPHSDSGLGMRTLRAIARKIDARLEFDSSCLGLTVRVFLPQG